MSASDPCSSPSGLLAREVHRAFHLQCHVDYAAGRAGGQPITFVFPLAVSPFLSLLPTVFSVPVRIRPQQQQKQAGKGQSSRFQLPTRLNTSVSACQEWFEMREAAMTTALPLCHLRMSCRRGGGSNFLTATGVLFLTLPSHESKLMVLAPVISQN